MATATIPSPNIIQNMTKAELKTFLEGLSADGLKSALESIDVATLKAGLEIVDAGTLKVGLEKIDAPTLKHALINIDRQTLKIAVRIIDAPTLRVGLMNVDAATLRVALESMDVDTLKVAMECLDTPTLKVALTDSNHKIDEATFAVAWEIVDSPTRDAMSNFRVPHPGTLSEQNTAKASLKEQIEQKIRIGNQGSTEITGFDYDSENKTLDFEAKLLLKHGYGHGLPTIQATLTLSGTVNLAAPGDSVFCAVYPANFQLLIGALKGCITGKEIAAALASA